MTHANPIEQLEHHFAALHAALGAVATGFGRGALYLALESIGVRGADVLVPDFICAQVLGAIEQAGGHPAFHEVPLDLTVTPAAVMSRLTPQTRAVILVHYFGAPQPHIAELVAACRARGIASLEDCSLALLAHHPAGLCGTFADYATFSFTKNNWCYGGGIAVARDPSAVESMRAMRADQFTPDDALCAAYGRLSQLDFESNRPSRARAAAEQGAQLQAELARTDPRFQAANFFDIPSCRTTMSPLAATRALEILRHEPAAASRRTLHYRELARATARNPRLEVCRSTPGNASFLPVACREGDAASLIDSAVRQGITLRPAWPAFQVAVPQTSHGTYLVTLEVHPALSVAEASLVSSFLLVAPLIKP